MSSCKRCQGEGTIKVPRRGSTQDKPLWKMAECPVCFGMGWNPRKRTYKERSDGYFAVHSERASHLSVSEILEELGL